jgi:tripartite-type tricarboxylate transporter receptor subunit TctC
MKTPNTLGLPLAAALMLCAGIPAHAAGQDYPNRPITIVVPYTAGGGVDIVARLLAVALQSKWGQSVVVENRAGGNGNIGAQIVSTSPADGYTLMASAEGPLVMNQSMYGKLNFDPTAFVPVSIVSASPIFVAVRPSVPAHNLKELIAYAKEHPGDLRYGTSGVGTPTHLTGVLLEQRTGMSIGHIPYKGSSQSLSDFLGGQINMLFTFQTSAGPYFNTDKMRIVAVASPQRLPQFPDIPTVAEDLPGFTTQSWVALVAAPGTPPAIAHKLSDAVAQALRNPDMKKRLGELGSTPIGSSPDEASAYLKEQAQSWGKVIRGAGLKVD